MTTRSQDAVHAAEARRPGDIDVGVVRALHGGCARWEGMDGDDWDECDDDSETVILPPPGTTVERHDDPAAAERATDH